MWERFGSMGRRWGGRRWGGWQWGPAGLLVLGLSACKGESASPEADDDGGAQDSGGADTGTASTGADDESGGVPLDRATVTHSWGVTTLQPLEEFEPCMQWTLDNDEAIYINAVTLANDGGFHHSNWSIVPETLYPGDDGYFDCGERGFNQLEAAVGGTVLTAQSTQSRYEQMLLPDGVVIKAPPRHKLIATAHLLNLANAPYDTEFRMSLDIIHPRDVQVVAAPFRLSYTDLEITAFSESWFSGDCDFSGIYESQADRPLDLKLYYVLPHYHYLGSYFDLTVLGGPRDGESVFRLDGFNASGNGQAYPDPIDLTGATGFRFTCGYDNWRDVDIGWGIGDQEMCVMLGLADSAVLLDGSVSNGAPVGEDAGVLLNEGACGVVGLPKNIAQSMPAEEEIAGDLYVPPTDPGDQGLPPLDVCEDTPADAEPELAATLTSVRDALFVSSCMFSSCHQGEAAVAGLDFGAENLHELLTTRDVQLSDVAMPLVTPGDPEASWLYRVVSECEPTDDAGTVKPHMPLNAPELSDPRLVALLRDWIAAGALDD
jgi:hypothetical protein